MGWGAVYATNPADGGSDQKPFGSSYCFAWNYRTILVHIIPTKYLYSVTFYRYSKATSRLNSHKPSLHPSRMSSFLSEVRNINIVLGLPFPKVAL